MRARGRSRGRGRWIRRRTHHVGGTKTDTSCRTSHYISTATTGANALRSTQEQVPTYSNSRTHAHICTPHITSHIHPSHAHHITSLHVTSHDSYTHTATPISLYHITTHYTTSHHMVSYMHTSTSQLPRWVRTRSKRSPDPSKLSLSPLPSHIHPSHTHP